MDDRLTLKGTLELLVCSASVIACCWMICHQAVQRAAIDAGLHQDRSGHWVTPVSGETGVSPDCDFIAPPRLEPYSWVPQSMPDAPVVPADPDSVPREAVHRVDH